jgi:hypothetical protein
MTRILAILSLIVFLLNAGAHVATFIDGVQISQRHTWPFHVAALVLFFAMFGTLVRDTMSGAARMGRMSKEELCHLRDTLQQTIRPRLFGSIPTWMVVFIVGLFLYVSGIMVAHAFTTARDGQVVTEDGQFRLVDDQGNHIRQLTAEEYARFGSGEVRIFAAGFAMLTFWSFTFFTYRRAAPRPPARFFETRPADL